MTFDPGISFKNVLLYTSITTFTIFYCFLQSKADNNGIPQDCLSLNDEMGKCVTLKACPFFVDVLKERPISKPNLRLLVELTCDYDTNDPKVCCPVRDIKEPKKLNRSKKPTRSEYKERYLRYETHPNFHLLPSFEECGLQLARISRIFGGKIAYRGQFPFMALLAYQNTSKSRKTDFFCGGTIVNERYILTAAHCLKKINDPRRVEVILGEYDLAIDPHRANIFDDDYARIYNIEEAIPHPEYDYSEESNLDNDIAIIRLDRNIEFNDLTRPVCLPFVKDYGLKRFPKRLKTVKNAIVSGWGRVGADGPPSSILRFAKLPIVLNELCEIDYYQYSHITAFQICAGGELNIDSCSGDSGGPLLYEHRLPFYTHMKLIQIGITSYGTSYCAKGVPSVYTRVTSFLLWILDTIEP